MVSIIIPCYNCEQYIVRAIDSVYRQSYTDWELILVNNNSTDGTQTLLENFQRENPQQIRIFQEIKKGAPAARNKGLIEAKGAYIQYLDADDELLIDKIKKQVQLIEAENSDVVVGEALQKRKKDNVESEDIRRISCDPWIGLITSTLGITSANLWRKQKLQEINGWDELITSSQEYYLMFSLLKARAKFSFHQCILTIIHKTENSISNNSDVKRKEVIIENRIGLRLKVREFLYNANQLTADRKKAIDSYIFGELRTIYSVSPQFVWRRINDVDVKISMKYKLYFYLKILVRTFQISKNVN